VNQPTPGRARRWSDAAARLCAVIGGILLAATAAVSWVIAGYADDVVDAGSDAAVDSIGDEGTRDWVERISDWFVDGRAENFRTLCLVAIAAGAIAIVAALPKRPHSLWPEAVWATAAIAGLAPNLAFDFWFSLWIFTGVLIAVAPVLHYLGRRSLAVAPGAYTRPRWPPSSPPT
jgi:hypothetical protein